MNLKRRKFLSLTGITVMTPFTLIAKKCKDCKFYLPDLEVDGYDLLTCKHPLCDGKYCIYKWCKTGECGREDRRKEIQYPTWPPKMPPKNKNKRGGVDIHNRIDTRNFADAKKGDYCFLIGGLGKRIPCQYFLSIKASEKEAEEIVEKYTKFLKSLNKNKNNEFLLNESKFKIDLRCSLDYRLTWLGKLLGRLHIR